MQHAQATFCFSRFYTPIYASVAFTAYCVYVFSPTEHEALWRHELCLIYFWVLHVHIILNSYLLSVLEVDLNYIYLYLIIYKSI